MARTVQSVNIPIHTAIGPNQKTLARTMTRDTLKTHMERMETTMEKRTSPAARNPYAGINASVHTTGLTIVMQGTIKIHIDALAGSIPTK